jgi:hypothetical protein
MIGHARTDDQCTIPVGLYWAACAASAPTIALDGDGRIYPVTGPAPVTALFDSSDGACRPLEAPSHATYGLAPAIPDTDFEAVAARVRDTGHRLRPIELAGGGFTRDTGGMFDTQLDLACRRFVDVDGLSRCAPRPGYQLEQYFADPACTTPLEVMRPFGVGFEPIGFPFEDVAGTPLGVHPSIGAPYRRRGALHAGPVYLRFPPDPCFDATPATPLYRVGGSIALADLVVLESQLP